MFHRFRKWFLRSVLLLLLVAGVLLGYGLSQLPGGGKPLYWFEAIQTLQALRSVTQQGGADQLRSVMPREITYQNASGEQRLADLYRSPHKADAPLLILMPGASPGGRRDARLQMLANALAFAGFTVLFPEFPNLKKLRISAADAEILADALIFASQGSEKEALRPGKVGLLAISYGVGPAVLALRQASVQDKVGFWVGIGGYHDLPALLTYLAGGWATEAEKTDDVLPAEYGRWVFVLANIHHLQNSLDQSLLRRMALNRLQSGLGQAHTADDVSAWYDHLTAEGRAILDLLHEQDPKRIPERIQALPEGILAEMAALDLSNKDLSALTMPALLVHGQRDPLIPPMQSQSLAAALPEGQAQLYLLAHFSHIKEAAIDPLDMLKMLDATAQLLAYRDEIRVGGIDP